MDKEQMMTQQSSLATSIDQLASYSPSLASHPGWQQYKQQLQEYFQAHQESEEQLDFPGFTFYPCLGDDLSTTPIDPYYFYQDTWAARKIFECRPKTLVDIGSTVLYAGIVSQFVPTKFVDIRPPNLNMPGFEVVHGSVLSLPFPDNSQEFVTSLCVVEHIGLGRYGDPIMPDGTRKACAELNRILSPGGSLILSVPVGPPCIAFNAHRIFSKDQFLSYFHNYQVLDEIYLSPHPVSPSVIDNLSVGEFVVWVVHLQKSTPDSCFGIDDLEGDESEFWSPRLELPVNFSIPPDHAMKQMAIKKISEFYSLSTLIETGTYLGEMVSACLANFSKIISIELSKELHDRAQEVFREAHNVTLVHGDSGKVFRTLVPTLKSPCLFWLDGHYSSGITAKGSKDTPILEELNSIGIGQYSLQSAILIDDARCFDGTGDYPSIEAIQQLCSDLFPQHCFLVSHDIIFVLPRKM
jgi:SAM-dependent methyltransferase